MLRPRGSGVHGTARPALVASLALTLAGCTPSSYEAFRALQAQGVHVVALGSLPARKWSCRWYEPWGIEFVGAVDGRFVRGSLCSSWPSMGGGRLIGSTWTEVNAELIR